MTPKLAVREQEQLVRPSKQSQMGQRMGNKDEGSPLLEVSHIGIDFHGGLGYDLNSILPLNEGKLSMFL